MEKEYKHIRWADCQHLPLVLNVCNVANFLGISASTTYKLFDKDDFPSFRICWRKMVFRSAFLDWLDKKHNKRP